MNCLRRNRLQKKRFDTTGTLLGTMEYGYGNGYLKPLDGTEYTYFSNYDTNRGSLVLEIRKYDNAKLIYKKRFHENQHPQKEVLYDREGITMEEISYNDKGEEIGRLAIGIPSHLKELPTGWTASVPMRMGCWSKKKYITGKAIGFLANWRVANSASMIWRGLFWVAWSLRSRVAIKNQKRVQNMLKGTMGK